MRGRRSRCKVNELPEPGETARREILHDSDEEVDDGAAVKGFFACYLLCSLSPRYKSHTYIGFTVNPQRRIKQHNGEKRCGAWRTKHGRPWEMVLCIYGFPSNVSALQFEWAWQHPKESLAVRKIAASFKSLSGTANKIKLAYSMLTLSCWESLNLTVNFFSTKYTKHTAGCPRLPNQMRVNVCSMDDLPCYSHGQALLSSIVDEEEDDQDGKEGNDASVDAVVEGIHGNIHQTGSSSQFWEPQQHNSGEEYYETSTSSPRALMELEEFDKRDSAIHSTPRISEILRVTASPKVDVINLCTPSSGIILSKTKRALFDSDIIDLTDSPVVIHV